MRYRDDDEMNDGEFHSRVNVSRNGSTIYFFDDIDSNSVAEAIKYIDLLESQKIKKITIILNSCGGEEYSGLALYDRMRASTSRFTIIGTGFIASMALIVYLGGDRRIATKNARFLNHQGSTEIGGKATDIKIESQEMETMENICVNIMAERTKQDPKKLKNSIKIGNKYMSASEAKAQGFVHEIIDEVKKGR